MENDSQIKQIHDDFRFYRQSGLALSITFIGLSSALLNKYFNYFVEQSNDFEISEYSIVFLLGSIFSSILIQIFHYFGYKTFAKRSFPTPKYSDKKEEWEKLCKSRSDHLFSCSDWCVVFAIGSFSVAYVIIFKSI